jgi:hypothetical protein
MRMDADWHLDDGGGAACWPVRVGPVVERVTTDRLPVHPRLCATCRSIALRRLDEVA